MDEFGSHVVLEIKADKIKQIDVHGIIGIIGPGNLVETAMPQPEFGDSQMMDEGVTGYGRSKV